MRTPSRLRDEQGSSLIAVIGIMAVFAIISVTIIGSTMSTLSATTSTRASVQAQAAAEAGIDVMRVALATDVCNVPQVRSDTAPRFDVVSLYKTAEGVVTDKCAVAQQVWIQSTGYAENASVSAKDASRSSTSVEAVFALNTTLTTVAGSPPAIYSWEDTTFKHGSTLADATSSAGVQVWNGEFSCKDSSIDATILVRADKAKVRKDCTVRRDVTAPKIETDKKGKIEGSSITASAAVPDWVNLSYSRADWVDFTEVPINNCDSKSVHEAIKANQGKKILLDARKCPGLKLQGAANKSGSTQANWNLHNDLAIFANSFETKSLEISSDSPTNLWLITPQSQDNGSNSEPAIGGNGGNGSSHSDGEDGGDAAAGQAGTNGAGDLTSSDSDRRPGDGGDGGHGSDGGTGGNGGDGADGADGEKCTGGKGGKGGKGGEGGDRRHSGKGGDGGEAGQDCSGSINGQDGDNGKDGKDGKNDDLCAGLAKKSKFHEGTIIGASVAALIYTPCDVELKKTSWRGLIYAQAVKLDRTALRYSPVGRAGIGPLLWGDRYSIGAESTTVLGEQLSIRDVD